jgi:hypothetical protein
MTNGTGFWVKRVRECPRRNKVCNMAHNAIMQCYARVVDDTLDTLNTTQSLRPYTENILETLRSEDDFLCALKRCLALCGALQTAQGGAFLIYRSTEHGAYGDNGDDDDDDSFSITHISHEQQAETCGIGRVFEQETPRVLVVHFKPHEDLWVLTPLVVFTPS